jgi:hypothetical protein
VQIAIIAALTLGKPPTGEDFALLGLSTVAFVPVALSGTYLGLLVFHRLSERGFARFLALMLVASGIGLAGVR